MLTLDKVIPLFSYKSKRMKFINLLVILWFSLCGMNVMAQKNNVLLKNDETLPKQNYEKNIKKEFINDIYIPKDLDEAFQELIRLSKKEGVEKFKNAKEEVVAKKLHFGLGRWIMEKWNIYDGSRYSHYLRQKGLSYPDDMARFTIISFHRHLNGVNLEVASRIKAVKDKRDKEYKDKLDKMKLIKEIIKEK